MTTCMSLDITHRSTLYLHSTHIHTDKEIIIKMGTQTQINGILLCNELQS